MKKKTTSKKLRPSVYKKRLLKLADVLRKLPEAKFDYGSWVGNNWKGKSDLSCGTTACALGWATTIPSLRRAGLRLGEMKVNTTTPFAPYMVGTSPSWSSAREAGMEIFGLTEDEFEFLFIPGSCLNIDSDGDDFKEDYMEGPSDDATAKQVAKHIRNFVKAKFGK